MRNPMTARRLGSSLLIAAVVVVAGFGVRHSVAAVYTVPLSSMEPELPRGSRILVYKLRSTITPGDIVAYHHNSGLAYLGRVVAVESTGALTLTRNGTGEIRVQSSDVIGRVVLSTR
jgi:signal peptidase I